MVEVIISVLGGIAGAVLLWFLVCAVEAHAVAYGEFKGSSRRGGD